MLTHFPSCHQFKSGFWQTRQAHYRNKWGPRKGCQATGNHQWEGRKACEAKDNDQWEARRQGSPQWEARTAGKADLGITGSAEPALILRQLFSVYARLQTLLMVASIASTIAQHNVVVLHLTTASESCPQRTADFIPECGHYAHRILDRDSPAKGGPGVLLEICDSEGLKNFLSSGAWETCRYKRHDRHRTNNDHLLNSGFALCQAWVCFA